MNLVQSYLLGFTAADGITLGIACVGAFTGIVSLALTARQFMLAGPRLRVEIDPAHLGANSVLVGGKWDTHVDPDTRADHPVPAVAVHAINAGRMPTMIESWGVDVGGNNILRSLHHRLNRELPAKIEAGERITFYVDLADVVRGNHAAATVLDAKRGEVQGVVTLGDGTSTRSKAGLTLPSLVRT